MPYLFQLAIKSAWNRRGTLGLIVLCVTLSTMLLLGVERVRGGARESFARTIAGTDLIVGARTSPIQLMLYSVFHLGEATNNISWRSYQAIASHPDVAWTIPISLGDSHRGFPVLGTTADYFGHFRYGAKQSLRFASGREFEDIFDAVIGAEVAVKLGYRDGSRVTLSHGTGNVNLPNHGDKPFTVVGVLLPTGTPVDQTVHVSLTGIEAIHLDWQGGAPMPGVSIPEQYVTKFDLAPKSITAALIGLKNRVAVFRVQRFVNDLEGEPLMAILPGVALDRLWEVLGVADRSLRFTSALVLATSLAGLAAVFLAGLGERRRELAVLRSVGAAPHYIVLLVLGESIVVTLAACLAGVFALDVVTWVGVPWIRSRYGLTLSSRLLSAEECKLVVLIMFAAALASTVPALRAYRQTLSDGLMPRA